MRLRHQALSVALAVAGLGLGGCARLLQTLLSPQDAAMSTATNVANTISAPAQGEIAGLGREVDRLLNGSIANKSELELIKKELARRLQDPTQGPSAQADPERLRPWHPRAPEDTRLQGKKRANDELRLGRPTTERGIAANGPLPDGTAPAELPTPLDLTRVRWGAPR